TRRIPHETGTDALLQGRIGEQGFCRQVNGSTIPPSWRDAAEVLRGSRGFAVILGDVDAGKSTLCTYLTNVCVDHRLRTSIIDGDVGQADIGPPATTSSSTVPTHSLSLQDLRPERSYFIVDTSPSSVQDKLVSSISYLQHELQKKRETTT